MKQEKTFWAQVVRRDNVLKNIIYTFFLSVASYPRLLIEVFIRQHFGDRYFKLSSALSVFVLLAVMPIPLYRASQILSSGEGTGKFWLMFLSWYAFLIVFLVKAIKRWKETKIIASVLDYNYFSLSEGFINPKAYALIVRILGPNISIRTQEIYVEPAFAFIPGFIFFLIGQPIGIVLMLAAIGHGFSYAAAYKSGDDFFRDVLDKTILARQKKAAFVDQLRPEKCQGVNMRGSKPTDRDSRNEMAAEFSIDGEEPTYAL